MRGLVLLCFGLVANPACDNTVTTTDTSDAATGSNGTGFYPPCNNNHQDGFCNAHGAVPETCECLDCSDTAFCKDGCKDDGNCDVNGGEDCTCVDCFGKQVGDDTCPFDNQSGPGPTSGPGPSSTTSGMGGAGSTAASTAAQTSAASTDASSASGTGGAPATSTTTM